jgi:hypothetical protein
VTHASAQQTSYAVSINPTQQAPAVLRQEPDPLTLMLGVCLAFWGVSATISAGIGVLMKLAGRPLAYASSRGGGSWTSTSVVDSDIMPLFLTYEDEQQPGAAAGVSRVPRDGTGVAYVPWTGPDSYIPGGWACVTGTTGCVAHSGPQLHFTAHNTTPNATADAHQHGYCVCLLCVLRVVCSEHGQGV